MPSQIPPRSLIERNRRAEAVNDFMARSRREKEKQDEIAGHMVIHEILFGRRDGLSPTYL